MIRVTRIALGVIAVTGVFGTRALYGALQANVVLSGTAKTCFAGDPDPVGSVSVSVYNVNNARPIIAHLDSMDRFTGFANGEVTATSRFNAMESQLQSMIVGTTALMRRFSASDGTFTFSVAPVDSVLVVGFQDSEDDPYAYAYKLMSGLSNTSFILDMSRGQCGF